MAWLVLFYSVARKRVRWNPCHGESRNVSTCFYCFSTETARWLRSRGIFQWRTEGKSDLVCFDVRSWRQSSFRQPPLLKREVNGCLLLFSERMRAFFCCSFLRFVANAQGRTKKNWIAHDSAKHSATCAAFYTPIHRLEASFPFLREFLCARVDAWVCLAATVSEW